MWIFFFCDECCFFKLFLWSEVLFFTCVFLGLCLWRNGILSGCLCLPSLRSCERLARSSRSASSSALGAAPPFHVGVGVTAFLKSRGPGRSQQERHELCALQFPPAASHPFSLWRQAKRSRIPASPSLVTSRQGDCSPEPRPPRHGFPRPPVTAGPAEAGRPESPLLDPRSGTLLQERTFSPRWLRGLGGWLMARPPLMELFQFWKVACASLPGQTVIYAVNSGLSVTAPSFRPLKTPGQLQPPAALPLASPRPPPSAPCPRPPLPPGPHLQPCQLTLSPASTWTRRHLLRGFQPELDSSEPLTSSLLHNKPQDKYTCSDVAA
ncbi:uncharacterized protein LOC129624259 [Bubalus kerabau]|uniref:uncharacterized protein LOC129624259 n=1 Tax=Bubalus carabanensis TaxID=3119969 RepID=UPI00244F0099|nr:uncharacterized protein LOC129624259 [Bubalus carabanensis]